MKLLVKSVKGLTPDEIINSFVFLRKSGAKQLSDLIKSAIANAVSNFNLKRENLKIKEFSVNTAGAAKRFRAASRGVAHSYKKRMTNVKIILEG